MDVTALGTCEEVLGRCGRDVSEGTYCAPAVADSENHSQPIVSWKRLRVFLMRAYRYVCLPQFSGKEWLSAAFVLPGVFEFLGRSRMGLLEPLPPPWSVFPQQKLRQGWAMFHE